MLYTQVPALSGGDRGLLDLLTLDRNGRLAVIELKADEDLHLPLQALDYWIRVRALNDDRQPAAGNEGGRPLSAFERQGYFAGAEVSPLGAAAAAGGSGLAHSSRQRAGAALFFSAGGVGADRAHRALAAGAEGGVPQAQRRHAELG